MDKFSCNIFGGLIYLYQAEELANALNETETMETETLEGKIEDLRDAIYVLNDDLKELEMVKGHIQQGVERVEQIRKDLYKLVN